jgi:lysophospholipase
MISLRLLPLALSAASVLGSYAPREAECPPGPLVRPADGLSDLEEAYRVARKAVADESLKSWLLKTNPEFGTDDLPTVRTTI